jgi:coniferyl-aldehyde dehydrogenase
VSADFGHRSTEQTLMTDIMPSVSALKHAKKHFESWARNEKRKPTFPLGLIGAKADVVYQPKGVVGVIAPGIFPVGMVMVPMAGYPGGGQPRDGQAERVYRTRCGSFCRGRTQIFRRRGNGGVHRRGRGRHGFSKLAFDHLIFTGATSVGKHIMRAAADNLVPVTLELGGKSPTIIGRSADKKKAGERIALGKMMNAGQICLAPDYLLVAKEQEQEMIDGVVNGVSRSIPAAQQ